MNSVKRLAIQSALRAKRLLDRGLSERTVEQRLRQIGASSREARQAIHQAKAIAGADVAELIESVGLRNIDDLNDADEILDDDSGADDELLDADRPRENRGNR